MNKSILNKKKFTFDISNIKSPREVMEEYSDSIKIASNNYVVGNINDYEGDIYSMYDSNYIYAAAIAAFGKGKLVRDVQNDLGEISGKIKVKLEYYLTAPVLKEYKCRLLFVEYGIGGYPANIVLEKEISGELSGDNRDYVYQCKNMEEFKALFERILNSNYTYNLMQGIITESLMREKIIDRNDSAGDIEVRKENGNNVFYMVYRNANAKGEKSGKGFKVLKGSLINPSVSDSCPQRIINDREKHAKSIGSDFALLNDIVFSSSSGAASFVAGASVSGPRVWKSKNGIKLAEIKTT